MKTASWILLVAIAFSLVASAFIALQPAAAPAPSNRVKREDPSHAQTPSSPTSQQITDAIADLSLPPGEADPARVSEQPLPLPRGEAASEGRFPSTRLSPALGEEAPAIARGVSRGGRGILAGIGAGIAALFGGLFGRRKNE